MRNGTTTTDAMGRARARAQRSGFCAEVFTHKGTPQICRLDKGHKTPHDDIRPSERAMAESAAVAAKAAGDKLIREMAHEAAIGIVRGEPDAEDTIHSARAGAVPAARALPRVHRVKSWPESFRAVLTGRKRYEVRIDDRNYQPGDTIELQEFRPELNQLQLVAAAGTPGQLTGRSWMGVIGYVTRGGPMPAGWCAFDLISVEDLNRLEGVRR